MARLCAEDARWAASLLAGLCAIVLHARAAHAAPSTEPSSPGRATACAVALDPLDASGPWKDAARELDRRLRAAHAGAEDCDSVTVHVTESQGALIVFTTRDGRQAVRRISSADDLVPMVEALAVAVPIPEVRPTPPIDPERPHETESASGVAWSPGPAPGAGQAAEGAHVLVGARGGGRIGAPGGFASPTFAATAAMAIGRWEIGIAGQWDPAAFLLGAGAPGGFRMSSLGVGANVGRREPVGACALVTGGSLSVVIAQEAGATPTTGAGATGNGEGTGDGASGSSKAEPRIGTYVGVVFPRLAPLRVRSELAADVVASRVGSPRSLDPALPALPWWSVALTVGAEWQVP
jgi:hypothetical protein